MKYFITGLSLLLLATTGWLLYRQLPAKALYDQLREENSLSLVNEPAQAAVSLRQSIQGWCCTNEDEMVPEVLAVVGWNRDLANAVDLLTYKMPGYSWLSPEQNKRAALLKAASGVLGSADSKVHYCKDERIAWIVGSTGRIITILREDEQGLHQELWTIYQMPSRTKQAESVHSRIPAR